MRTAAALVSISLFCAFSAFAAAVTVGCPGGTPATYPSIGAALAALDNQGPHTITVTGTCSETVTVDQRERLTIQAPPAQTATINGTNLFGVSIRDSATIVLRNLNVTGVRAAISVANLSSVAIAGVNASSTSGAALDIFGGAAATVGGPNAADAVVLHDSPNGLRIEGSTVFVAGWLTSEDNGTGVFIDSGRLETFGSVTTPAPNGGPVVIRNNTTAGITAMNGALVQLARQNFIQDNGTNGVILTAGAILHLTGATTIEGNPTSGVAVLFNSTLRVNGPNVIRNNGSPSNPFRSGISANHGSMVWVGAGAQLVDNTGRGILADSGTTVRLDNTTISGNSEAGIELIHGSILESIAGNNVPVNGAASMVCDATAIVFGDLTGVAAFECEKKEEKK